MDEELKPQAASVPRSPLTAAQAVGNALDTTAPLSHATLYIAMAHPRSSMIRSGSPA